MANLFRSLPCLALAACMAAPAHAGDLTGTWKGKFKCKLENGEVKQKLSSKTITAPEPGVSTLTVRHAEGAGTSALQMEVDGVLFSGSALP